MKISVTEGRNIPWQKFSSFSFSFTYFWLPTGGNFVLHIPFLIVLKFLSTLSPFFLPLNTFKMPQVNDILLNSITLWHLSCNIILHFVNQHMPPLLKVTRRWYDRPYSGPQEAGGQATSLLPRYPKAQCFLYTIDFTFKTFLCIIFSSIFGVILYLKR